MTINLSVPVTHELKPRITVIGVGGAGGNAVNNMITAHLEGVEFIVGNTDAQALSSSLTERRIQLGASLTQGLGAGARPDIGRAAAEEVLDTIVDHLQGANMIFITAGMGGGTGTGGAPVVAKSARDQGILTVGVVTKPFHFEGAHRMRIAEQGIAELQACVDTLIVIPNQNLFRIANENTTFADAFKMADDVLYSGVRGVTDLMVMPGLINLDFADVRSVMMEMGKAMMGTGEAEGDKRALDAAENAINNPLLDDVSLKGARGVLVNITGGPDMTLYEVDEACNHIRDQVDSEANIIFGSTFDEQLAGKVRVSVVATGIEAEIGQARVQKQGQGEAQQQQAAPSVPVLAPEPVVPASPVAREPLLQRITRAAQNAAAAPAMDRRAPAVPPRGQTDQNGAFVPPRPAAADMPAQEEAQLALTADPMAEADMLNASPPPSRETPPSERVSLFERMTRANRARPPEPARAKEAPQVQEPPRPPARPARREPEPVLELAEAAAIPAATPPAPEAAKVEEDVLDIPAFLRRQAN